MVPALILLLLFFSFILIKSADLVIVALRRIGKRTKTGVFALSAIILALGTSLPELFVGVTSAIEGTPNLALGVVMGSNIANITLVAGFAALVAGRVYVHGNYIKRDMWVALVAGIIPILLLLDGTLSRVDGLALLAIYFAYSSSIFKRRYMEIAEEHKKESFVYRFLRRFSHVNVKTSKEFGKLFIGIAFLLISADFIVKIASNLANTAGVPIFVVGLVVVAIGTSLPELVFSFRSLEDHEPSMFFGNLLGSVIANSTLVIGVTCLITPITVGSTSQYITAAITFVIVALVFWYFVRSKHRLDRWEALVLVLIYFVFVIVEFI
jgi:cation:H+ antiporter